jgi:hypothetical protein
VFGYITIPMMSFTILAAVLVITLVARMGNRYPQQ